MDEDLKALLGFAGIVALLIFSCVAACQISDWHDTDQIAKLVAGGADPIRAGCAVHGIHDTNREVCRAVLSSN